MDPIKNIVELHDIVKDNKYIFFEGCRGSGKTYTAKKFCCEYNYAYYKTCNILPSRNTDHEKAAFITTVAGLDVTQASVFVLDMLRQIEPILTSKLVLDRSYLSSCVFNGVYRERLALFTELCKELNVVFVLMSFDEETIRQRLVSRKIYGDRINSVMTYVQNEYLIFLDLLKDMPVKSYILPCTWSV